MPKSWEEIVNIVEQRRRADHDIINQMASVKDRYTGDYVVALPEVEGEPDLPPSAPALIGAAIDSTAMLAASTEPNIICPAQFSSERSLDRALTRERALRANWRFSQMRILRRRAYRHHAAYGVFSFIVLPDYEHKRARVELRDPLGTYPEVRASDDIRDPRNIAYVFGRSTSWLRKTFPDNPQLARLISEDDFTAGDLWDVIEWIDEDEIVMGVKGLRRRAHVAHSWLHDHTPAGGGVELSRIPNRAGMVPAVAPRRITLEKVAGQVSQVVGLFDLMNKLMALDIEAAKKAIFPDRYVIGQEGRSPQLVGGEWKDGRTGQVNLLLNAQQVGELVSTQGPLVHPVIDRIERAIRIGGGVAPFFTGETVGSLRTGRAMGELAAVSIDPRIQEMQEQMEEALRILNTSIMAVEKGYWPNRKYTVFSGGVTDRQMTSYKPATDFETLENEVRYPFIGLDASQLSVILPQRVASGMMATKTAMILDPFVDDPDAEKDRIWQEQIDQAMSQSMLQQATAGTLPLIDVARIRELVGQGEPIVEAIQQANREAQERQAEQPEPGAPEAQPGLAEPGQGAEAGGGGQFPEVSQDLNRAAQLRQVLGAIRSRA